MGCRVSSSHSVSDRCHYYILSSLAQLEFSSACVGVTCLQPLLQVPRVLYRLRLPILIRRHRCRCPIFCTDSQSILCRCPRCGRPGCCTGTLLRACCLLCVKDKY